jgi:murein L,D-transpeptidase YcbB/YkuD
MHRRLIAGAGAALAAAVAVPVLAAVPASAETFDQYQENCFNEGGTVPSDPYDGFVVPAEQLVEGDADLCVAYLQELLDTKGWWFNNGQGYGLATDGDFGPLTENAVVSFQTNMNLSPDGIVGPLTWTQLGPSRD